MHSVPQPSKQHSAGLRQQQDRNGGVKRCERLSTAADGCRPHPSTCTLNLKPQPHNPKPATPVVLHPMCSLGSHLNDALHRCRERAGAVAVKEATGSELRARRYTGGGSARIVEGRDDAGHVGT
jgi:hypothetical protein